MREIDLLLANLDQAYDAKAWHGTNLRGSVRGLSIDELVHRPDPSRHNIWELVVHCAYWKYAVRRRFTGEKRGSFPLQGSNFFERPDPGDPTPLLEAWKRDLALLDEIHASLRAEIERIPAKALDAKPKGQAWTTRATILGIASHDLYHAGQIQLLKRLARDGG